MRRRRFCAIFVLFSILMVAILSCSQPSGGSDPEPSEGGSGPEEFPPFQLMEAYRLIDDSTGSALVGAFPNGTPPTIAGRYDFGSIAYGYAVLFISNKGSGPVAIQSIALSEGEVEDFAVSMQKTESPLQPNAETLFELWFDPAETDFTGKASAQVVIATDKGNLKLGVDGGDATIKPAVAPQRPVMTVFHHPFGRASLNYFPNQWYPVGNGMTTLGYPDTAADGPNEEKNIWILELHNNGEKDLRINGISLGGVNDFYLLSGSLILPATIPPGKEQFAYVCFDPLDKGKKETLLTISDDSAYVPEQNFRIYLQGKGVAPIPDIALMYYNGSKEVNISSGDTIDIGNYTINNQVPKIVTIYFFNVGKVSLHIDGSNMTTTGDTNDIWIDANPSYDIHPLDDHHANNMGVLFYPQSAGTKKIVVSIPSDDPDPDENPFTFTIKGTGVAAP
jgi:hypothetical protein